MLLGALAALAQLGLVLGAPVPPSPPPLQRRDYPALSYYGYAAAAPASKQLLAQPDAPSDTDAGQSSDPEGAVHARLARAALMRAEHLAHRTWEVATFYQAKAEVYGVPARAPASGVALNSAQPGDDTVPDALSEAVGKLPAVLDVAGDGFLVDGERASQADVFSLVPLVWASGDRGRADGMLSWLRERGLRDQASGAYSHRGDGEQLWSDQGYMVPPALAFMGQVRGDGGLLREALGQWTSVARALQDDHGTFRHVPAAFDAYAWTSGTGWMLQGLARVLRSIEFAGKTGEMQGEISEAKDIARRALFAAYGAQVPDDGRLPNYTDRDSPPETAGTAGVTAAYFRLLAIDPSIGNQWLFDRAQQAYAAVMDHVGADGTVSGCVDPSGADFDNADTDDSPECHAFVALMWAARNAWLGLHPDGKLPKEFA